MPRGPAASVAEVMFRCWHRLVGPRDGALSEELGKVDLGRWGDGRGSPVNKIRPKLGNHLLLIELVGPFFFFFFSGKGSVPGCALAVSECQLSPAKGPRRILHPAFVTLWGHKEKDKKANYLYWPSCH